ncbi:MAG: PRC-barrel domain-containing protein [Firmicutes bacterium]|nr:PRC-barrel domain-containing protein [Bacillota bacterium]
MRRSEELIGLPVISISEGLEAGRVKCLVINAPSARVSAIAVEGECWFEPPRVVDFSLISAVGGDAITVENLSALCELSALPEIAGDARIGVRVAGTRVVTRAGRFIGTVRDFTVDTSTGQITSLEVDGPDAGVVIPAEQVITLGRHVVVVEESAGARQEEGTADHAHEPLAAPATPSSGPQDLGVLFQARHERFLTGRKATATVRADDGTVIIERGQRVTQAVIDRANAHGRFAELSASTETEERE